MKAEVNQAKDKFVRISYIFVALSFVLNIVMLFLISGTHGELAGVRGELDRHNKILITLPPDLQNEISATFKQTAGKIESEILRIVGETSSQIAAASDKKNTDAFKQITLSVEKQLSEQGINTNTQLAEMSKQIKIIATRSDETGKILAELKSERGQKFAAYLKAARASKANPEIAQLLYVSALTYTDDKAPLLLEYIDWQISLIKGALESDNIESAQERLIALASICDANIALGSVKDMASIPMLKEKLSSADQLIAEHKNHQIADQQKAIATISEKTESISTYEEVEVLLKELSGLTVDSSLDVQKDAITAKIILKQSCLTTPTHQIIIPAINDETPWCAWLQNFAARLKSDLPIAKKLEDIGTAAEFLQVAKSSNAEGVADLIKEIETASRNIYMEYWRERVARIKSADASNLNEISSLITESNSFSREEQQANVEQITRLNKLLVRATLNEFNDGLTHLKSLEGNVADETYAQMVGATQGQYIQFLLRLEALNSKFSGTFTNEIVETKGKISYLGQLLNAYKNKLVATDLRKNETQRIRFAQWAKRQLDEAKELDDAGEAIASTWTKTRSSEEAINNYVAAWLKLMSIHPGDLQSVDPAMFQRYSELKQLIENHKSPTDHMRNQVVYKRITDF